MTASWSRPIPSPKNIRGTTSANRKKHGRRNAPGLAGPAGPTAGDLLRLDRPFEAGTILGPGAAAALDGTPAALLPPLVLPHSRSAGAPDRAADAGSPGALRRQSHLLSRHHGPRIAAPGLIHRQARGRELAAVRLAGAAAALGVHRPRAAQHAAAARQHRRPARRQ